MGRKAASLGKMERVRPPEPVEAVESFEEVEEELVADAEDELEAEVISTDNVGEVSIEINVESLIAEVEAESRHGHPADVKCARRKLEDFLERKRIAEQLEDFEDFEVGD